MDNKDSNILRFLVAERGTELTPDELFNLLRECDLSFEITDENNGD